MPKSVSSTDTTSTAVVEEKPKDGDVKDEKTTDEKTKDDTPTDDGKKDEKPKDEKKTEKSVVKKDTLKAPEVAGRPVTPTGERGKSKTTGKTISGWL